MKILPDTNKRDAFLLLFLLIFSVSVFCLDLLTGSSKIPAAEVLNILLGGDGRKSWEQIILHFRLPKAVSAALIGAGLSVAGLLMQALFRNPLAGPYVLGINSGASLGVALFVLGGSAVLPAMLSGAGIAVSAVVGAMLVLLIVLAASSRIKDSVSLLILGIMFGSLAGSAVSILQYFSSAELVQRFVVWTFGSLANVDNASLALMAPPIIAGLGASVYLAKPLNALALGQMQAEALGVDMRKVRLYCILACSLIAGSITAFAGPIAFIGVAVPHIARGIFRTSNHTVLVPACILAGSSLMLICDILSNLPGAGLMLPINAVTAFFGAPVVIWVVLASRPGRGFQK
jgi:iron complex transport system permease protein